ncbi:hypothetical protein SLEP1_g32509 [Rubroshorea leprosula]|uniref:Uncharacterized protein n=1 Tax=Rubroshorea leprosula TaxID=152421 RepID=A0AAV5KDI6_9ROSI|nr:hypothetical protein SLEP1_g32509 [Rubroshorea leprosula]
METSFNPHNLHFTSNIRFHKQNHPDRTETEHDASGLSLRSLTKIILPPLGVSNFNQNEMNSKGWFISPMDSRYSYHLRYFGLVHVGMML